MFLGKVLNLLLSTGSTHEDTHHHDITEKLETGTLNIKQTNPWDNEFYTPYKKWHCDLWFVMETLDIRNFSSFYKYFLKKLYNTQVNRMSKSRRVLAIGGKQRIFGLHMVCFEMVLYHNEPH